MKYRMLELRVGFTVFIAILIFTIGLMWFEGFKIGRHTYEINAVFPMVGGINVGDVVSVNGVEKGEVSYVMLRDRDVVVGLKIDTSVKIPVDSKVVLETHGIMGERIVTIVLGKSDGYLEKGATLEGVYDPGISEALASVARVVGDLKELAANISVLTETLSKGDNLAKTVENFSAMTGELREFIERNSDRLDAGVRSFSNSALKVDSLLSRNTAGIDSIVARLEEAGEDLPELVGRITEMAAILGDLSKRLNTSDTTLGALFNDRELLDRLEASITGLDELVADIKANPKKYLKIEIF